MSHDIELPEIFPLEEIRVEEEPHLFEVFQGDSSPLPKTEYTIDKAPIIEIEEITGTVNGRSDYVFEKGTDYELSSDNNDVVWLNGERPDAGTNFFVTYLTDSIISRYVESGSEEFDTVDEKIIEATKNKFVGQAEGKELDEIGKLFGQTIGKRRGRTDTQYRIYLQSVVQSFVSRGTKTGIKLAISAATEVPVADITINENFETNKYEVIVIPNTAVRVSLLEEISDIADPSGIEQIRTRFPIFDEMGVSDRGGGPNDTGSNRLSAYRDNDPSDFITNEALGLTDVVTIPPKGGDIIETSLSQDTAAVPPKDAVTSDSATSDDATTSSSITVEWDTGSWDDMNWAVEHN